MYKNKALYFILLIFILTGCSINQTVTLNQGEELLFDDNVEIEVKTEVNDSAINEDEEQPIVANTFEEEKKEVLEVHFIDVGQGDATLIKNDSYTMLIDAGDRNYSDFLVDYLKSQDVDRIDYIIATHPHADHIGGLSLVIENFEIGKIIMPKVSHNTRTFENLLLTIQENNLRVTSPKVGDIYNLGSSDFVIIAPSSDEYNNLNDYSVGIKLNHGNHAFVFTGDAEETSEREIVKLGLDLNSNVLKVPHHGSRTSSTLEFVEAVNPDIAVFSLGLNNRYGHPHDEILQRYQNTDIYRTDLNGTIVILSDGDLISVKTEKEANSPPEISNLEKEDSEKDFLYIGNKNSKIFHINTCSSLPSEANRIKFKSRDEAINAGHRPCKRCQ